VQALAASGALAGSAERTAGRGRAAELEVPATVRRCSLRAWTVSRRTTSSCSRRAAVIGKPLLRACPAAIVGLPTGEVDGSLATLERAEFIHGETETEYVFRHPLPRKSPTDRNSRAARRAARRGRTGPRRSVRRPARERAALIAHHWEKARRPAQAARWRRLAHSAWHGSSRVDRPGADGRSHPERCRSAPSLS